LCFILGLLAFVGGLNLLLLPLSFVALLAFTAAVSLWVAALNVRYRDVQHLLNLALITWFWLTPIVYSSGFVYEKLTRHPFAFQLFLVNPMAVIVMGFQRALYAVVQPAGLSQPVLAPVSLGWLTLVLGAVTVGSIGLLFLAWRTFFRLSGDFAEDL
ncbi:MAG TPA: ABC transporter permease, partial [Actinomycetota bacterium]|nr:ABC transporter permease [Actinomycetota bacterium]